MTRATAPLAVTAWCHTNRRLSPIFGMNTPGLGTAGWPSPAASTASAATSLPVRWVMAATPLGISKVVIAASVPGIAAEAIVVASAWGTGAEATAASALDGMGAVAVGTVEATAVGMAGATEIIDQLTAGTSRESRRVSLTAKYNIIAEPNRCVG